MVKLAISVLAAKSVRCLRAFITKLPAPIRFWWFVAVFGVKPMSGHRFAANEAAGARAPGACGSLVVGVWTASKPLLRSLSTGATSNDSVLPFLQRLTRLHHMGCTTHYAADRL